MMTRSWTSHGHEREHRQKIKSESIKTSDKLESIILITNSKAFSDKFFDRELCFSIIYQSWILLLSSNVYPINLYFDTCIILA